MRYATLWCRMRQRQAGWFRWTFTACFSLPIYHFMLQMCIYGAISRNMPRTWRVYEMKRIWCSYLLIVFALPLFQIRVVHLAWFLRANSEVVRRNQKRLWFQFQLHAFPAGRNVAFWGIKNRDSGIPKCMPFLIFCIFCFTSSIVKIRRVCP